MPGVAAGVTCAMRWRAVRPRWSASIFPGRCSRVRWPRSTTLPPVRGSRSHQAADVLLCGLAVGHVSRLDAVLAEFARISRPGATLVVSDFHPVGAALGWRRDFKAGGQRYAVRHATHYYSDWHAACVDAGLAIDAVAEPMLDPADIPSGARFDPVALDVPVALVMRLRRLAR